MLYRSATAVAWLGAGPVRVQAVPFLARKLITAVAGLLPLVLVITACAPLAAHPRLAAVAMADPIALVKRFAGQLPSPPRLYATSGQAVGLWPDQRGSITVAGLGGSGITTPMRQAPFADHQLTLEGEGPAPQSYELITSTDPDAVPGGMAISLELRWNAEGKALRHAWLFHVFADGVVRFMQEEGHPLPYLPV
jgi:hypothetical protein